MSAVNENKRLEKPPIKFSNLLVGSGLNMFEVSTLGQPPKGADCQAMDGILAEAKEIMSDCGDDEVRDAAMLSAAQAVEHYEMTRYGTILAFAQQLGKQDAVQPLHQTLAEEKATDQKLTQIAESRVNKMAA